MVAVAKGSVSALWISAAPLDRYLNKASRKATAPNFTKLTSEDIEEINTAAPKIPIQGDRLPESILRMSYR